MVKKKSLSFSEAREEGDEVWSDGEASESSCLRRNEREEEWFS